MKKQVKIITTIFFLLFSENIVGQSINLDSLLGSLECNCDTAKGIDPILVKISEPARFPGGDSLLWSYFTKELSGNFYDTAYGKFYLVEILFTIDTIGRTKGPIYISWHTPENRKLEKHLQNVFLSMPKWEPEFLLKKNKKINGNEGIMLLVYPTHLIMKFREKIWGRENENSNVI